MRKRRVWMAINNFARSPLFTRERWRNRFPLVMGKQTEKTNRFRREEDWTQNQICTTRVSRRIGVVGLFDIHCTGKCLEGARLKFCHFIFFGLMFCCVRPDNQNIRTWRAEVEAGIGRKQISIVNIFFTYSLCLPPVLLDLGQWAVFFHRKIFLLSRFRLQLDLSYCAKIPPSFFWLSSGS